MYKEIFKLRNMGLLRISTVTLQKRLYPESPEKDYFSDALKRMGLYPIADRLIEINSDQAKSIVTKILSEDLAYKEVLMSEEKATSFAVKLLNDFLTDESIIYTNATWSEKMVDSSKFTYMSYNPLTPATIDNGIIIKNIDHCCCIWAQDND